MAEAIPSQRKPGIRADSWWVIITGIIVVLPNASVVVLATSIVQPYPNYLDLSLNNGDENLATVYILYFLLFGLILFLAGLLHGRMTGKVDASLLISLEASLFGGALAFAVLPLLLSLTMRGQMVGSLLVILAVSPIVIGLLGVLAMAVGGAGGLVGSRFLPKRRSTQEAAAHQERSLSVKLWMRLISSILLVVLNTAFVLVEVVRLNMDYFSIVLHLDLGMLETEGQTTLYFQLLLPCLLIFLLIGIIHGRIAGSVRSGLFASMLPCLVGGGLGLILLPLGLATAIGGEMGFSFLSIAIVGGPLWLGVQLVLAAVGGAGGGLIGSRLLRKQSLALWERLCGAKSRCQQAGQEEN